MKAMKFVKFYNNGKMDFSAEGNERPAVFSPNKRHIQHDALKIIWIKTSGFSHIFCSCASRLSSRRR